MRFPTTLVRLACAAACLLPLSVAAKVPAVVTDIPPVHSLVAMVMGDLGTPELLVGGGADAHSYQLRPSQARALHSADLIFWIGPEMTPWLTTQLGAASQAHVIGLLDDPATKRLAFDDEVAPGGAAPAGATERTPVANSSVDGHGHDHEGVDPHAWLDPDNARAWVTLIAGALSGADPEHAADYIANAAAATRSITAADESVRQSLGPNASVPIIVGHDAFGYFAAHYGLNIVAAVTSGDAAEPGAARLSTLTQLARASGADCFMPIAGADPTRYTWLTEGTSIRTGQPLDPEGQAIPPGPGLYPTLLENLGRAIGDCAAGR